LFTFDFLLILLEFIDPKEIVTMDYPIERFLEDSLEERTVFLFLSSLEMVTFTFEKLLPLEEFF
jgi:hypothetical protein